jgi:hypothetical protein
MNHFVNKKYRLPPSLLPVTITQIFGKSKFLQMTAVISGYLKSGFYYLLFFKFLGVKHVII